MIDDDRKARDMLLQQHRERVANARDSMRLWKGLCGRYPENYGIRMPDNLTSAALMVGVLAS